MPLGYNDQRNLYEFQVLMSQQLEANSYRGAIAIKDCNYFELIRGIQKHFDRFVEAMVRPDRDLPKAMLAAINLANFAVIAGINVNAEMVESAMPTFEIPKTAGSDHVEQPGGSRDTIC